MSHRLVVGCMTGTSLDGLDVALVRIDGRGLAMRAAFVEGLSLPLGDLAPPLRDLAEQRPATAGVIAALSRRLALLHAEAVSALLGRRGLEPASVSLIAAHGQTVFHAPPVSWQLFSPAVLAQATGVRVVSDLRAADLARGGQGAPITPIADWVFFRAGVPVAVVNLGGFCNITLLPAEASGNAEPTPAGVRGFDLCACNHALDAVARVALDAPFDRDGRAALAGRIDARMTGRLSDLLDAQSRSGRSLGTGDELAEFLRRACQALSGPDACASACAAVGSRIGRACAGSARVLLAGGGARNAALVGAIRAAAAPAEVMSTADAPPAGTGVDPAYREAAHMAVLGALCDDRVPITLASTTGVSDPPPAGLFTP
jgi:1,6-anhydro-N-acetylmuramate kinase